MGTIKLFTLNIILTAFILVSLSACSSYSLRTFNKIDVGMTKNKVLDKLGSPAQSQYRNGIDYFLYRFFQNGTWVQKEIQFKEDQVIYVGDFMGPIQRERYEYRSPTENLQELEGQLKKSR